MAEEPVTGVLVDEAGRAEERCRAITARVFGEEKRMDAELRARIRAHIDAALASWRWRPKADDYQVAAFQDGFEAGWQAARANLHPSQLLPQPVATPHGFPTPAPAPIAPYPQPAPGRQQ